MKVASAHLSPVESVELSCPACEQPRQPGDDICPYCGLVYARYRPRSERILQQQQEQSTAKQSTGGSSRSSSQRLEGRKVYLSSRQLTSFLLGAAEALEAGLTFQSFTQGPLMGAMPLALAQQLQAFAAEGVSLADALEAVRLLDAAAIALLRVGESQGKLPSALRVVTERVTQRRQDRHQLLRKLSYPVLLLVVHYLISPLSVLILQGTGAYIKAVSGPLLMMGAVCFVFFGVLPRLDPDNFVFRTFRTVGAYLPPFSYIRRHNAIATFSGTLGACVAAGLPLRPSLHMACEATQHPAFQHAASDLLAQIEKGSNLTEALSSLPILPKVVLAQIGHGEQVGALDHVLARTAEQHREKHRTATTATIVFLGILATVVIFAYLILSIVSQWKTQVNGLENQLNGLFRQLIR